MNILATSQCSKSSVGLSRDCSYHYLSLHVLSLKRYLCYDSTRAGRATRGAGLLLYAPRCACGESLIETSAPVTVTFLPWRGWDGFLQQCPCTLLILRCLLAVVASLCGCQGCRESRTRSTCGLMSLNTAINLPLMTAMVLQQHTGPEGNGATPCSILKDF